MKEASGINRYSIIVTSGLSVGVIIIVQATTPEEVSQIESLRTGSIVHFKGRISGVSLRNVTVEPAILLQ
ncbi:hypothetical protein BOW39_12585 [Solemya velum gill symbiont]|uniref:hypothetical protein n=1 Tax=Solemya velum gill symbiont TaxID=2340 RepID=UPI000996112A|nr:hypothetical protein [Solemya velum gill symbiont]OOZ48056.1 hypothetical protein BOW39_12585 [Solemya velum gill symbiont]